MSRLTLALLFVVTAAPAAPAAPAAAQARDPELDRLEREITRLAPLAGGTVGVEAIHLESGREVFFNRAEPFPMASTPEHHRHGADQGTPAARNPRVAQEGTIGGTTNDAGIVTLPGDAGHVVTVVFVKGSDETVPERERAIAHIARAIHDYFVFHPAPSRSRGR